MKVIAMGVPARFTRIQPVPPKRNIFGLRVPGLGLGPQTSASLVENELAGLSPGYKATWVYVQPLCYRTLVEPSVTALVR